MFSRSELSSRRVRSSRAQLRLRSFAGEQQEIWRHQSRRGGAVQETRPGDKLVSLTGELGPGGGGGKQAAKHSSPTAGRDRWIYPYQSTRPSPTHTADRPVTCSLSSCNHRRWAPIREGFSRCSYVLPSSRGCFAAPDTATRRLQPVYSCLTGATD